MEGTAVHPSTTQTCGGIPGSQIPNNTFGYGRFDAFAAYQFVIDPTAVTLSGLAASSNASPLLPAVPMVAVPLAAAAAAAAGVWARRRRSA